MENRWAHGMRNMLEEYGLLDYWEDQMAVVWLSKEGWREVVYAGVDQIMLSNFNEGFENTRSGWRYNRLRYWGRIPAKNARSKADIGRPAHRCVPRYLDEWMTHRGTCRLKLACRTGTLPTVGRLANMGCLEDLGEVCLMCGMDTVFSWSAGRTTNIGGILMNLRLS